MTTSAIPARSTPATAAEAGPQTATLAGVGFSTLAGGREAGAAAARDALTQAGASACDLVLVYGGGKYDPREVLAGIRAVVGEDPRVVGCQSTGAIGDTGASYGGYEVAVAVIRSDRLRVEALLERELDKGEFAAGARLGRRLAARLPDGGPDPLLVLTYDIRGVHSDAGWRPLISTKLLAGIRSELPRWPMTIGGGMVATWDFDQSAQWLDDEPVDRSALAVLLSGLHVDSVIMHGSRPTSAYYSVTRADGTTVLELDGQPALDVVLGLVDAETAQSIEGFPPILTVGVNAGDPFGEPHEEDFVVRGCLSLDHERRGLVFQNDDLTLGTRLQLMRRSIDMGDVRQRVAALLARLEGRRPVLAIYFDCAGRASTICSSDGEDAHAVREALGPDVPLIGAYSWMELAHLHGDLRALNYTGVLTVLSE